MLSIYYSENGGDTWKPVSGTLEETADGSGNGPSVRWLDMLYVNGQPVYFAATSAGLFSAKQLNGMNTVWVQEGAETIGNVILNMVQTRQSDGLVAVATLGNGIYSTNITEVPSSVSERVTQPENIRLFPAYPNPFNRSMEIRFVLPQRGSVKLRVFNLLGQRVATLLDQVRPSGEQTVRWDAEGCASGEYLMLLNFENNLRTQKVLLQR